MVIDPINNRGIDIVAARRRDHHFFGARRNVCRGFRFAGKKSGALEHEVDTQFTPRQFAGVTLRDDSDAVAVDHHRIAVDMHFAAKPTVRRIEAGQMSIGIGIAQIVDRDDLDITAVLTFVQRPQNIAADSSITIDAHFDCHRL